MCQLRVYSKDIVEDLINIGVVTRKTDKPNFPLVPNEFFYDFLRGYIDGDGCYYAQRGYIGMHITCSHSQPLEYIQSKLSQDKIKTTINKEKDHKFRLYCTNQNDMKILINKMFNNKKVLCLSRKYNKIKSFLIGSAT